MTLQIYSNYLDYLTHMDTLKGYVLKKNYAHRPVARAAGVAPQDLAGSRGLREVWKNINILCAVV